MHQQSLQEVRPQSKIKGEDVLNDIKNLHYRGVRRPDLVMHAGTGMAHVLPLSSRKTSTEWQKVYAQARSLSLIELILFS